MTSGKPSQYFGVLILSPKFGLPQFFHIWNMKMYLYGILGDVNGFISVLIPRKYIYLFSPLNLQRSLRFLQVLPFVFLKSFTRLPIVSIFLGSRNFFLMVLYGFLYNVNFVNSVKQRY